MLIRRVGLESNVVWYESPRIRAAGFPHGFSTRLGGISPPPFDSLNLGNPSGCPVQDSLERIEQNYHRLRSAIGGADRRILRVHQVHGDQIAVAQADHAPGASCKADAIVLEDRQFLASVRVADCVPVLLAVADGSAAAAVHAGWRGVVTGVVPRALAKLAELHPGAAVLAAIGPCIGMDAFEVGPEVLAAFEQKFPQATQFGLLHRRNDGKGHVDLRQAISRQLQDGGLSVDQIDATDRCTVRHADEFFSHRRDNGVTGRMAALIGLP